MSAAENIVEVRFDGTCFVVVPPGNGDCLEKSFERRFAALSYAATCAHRLGIAVRDTSFQGMRPTSNPQLTAPRTPPAEGSRIRGASPRGEFERAKAYSSARTAADLRNLLAKTERLRALRLEGK